MQEVEGGDYRDRTRKNVLDSDGTAIIYFGEIEGGTESVLDDCVQLAKPYQLINGAETQPGQAAKLIADFIRDRGLQTLNVAGPRASKVEKGHKYAFDTVCMAIDQLGRKSTPAKRPAARGGRQQQRPNGQGQQAGGANGNERTGQGRNSRFSNQRRKSSGQQNRAKQGVKSP
jgi:Circularly permutated YpsA SLOG family